MKMIRHFADEHEHEHDKLLVLLMSTTPSLVHVHLGE